MLLKESAPWSWLVGLVWFGLVWFGLGWVGLVWFGLGWVGLGWLVGWLVGYSTRVCFPNFYQGTLSVFKNIDGTPYQKSLKCSCPASVTMH
jgi:hypothetical protein